MKKLMLLWIVCMGLTGLNGQSVDVSSPCFGGSFTFTFDAAESPDASGRNVYFFSGANLEIRFNTTDDRWEVRARGGSFDVYYVSTFASAPNPPDSGTAAWDDFSFCDETGAPSVTGDGTQNNLGGDPCDGLGGDADGDGVCDENDVCPGNDDDADQDNDNIPDACDADPSIPNGILLDAPCLDPGSLIVLLPDGTDDTGRYIHTNHTYDIEVSYNAGLERWEIRAQSPGTDVYFYNAFASHPNPPATGTGDWVGNSFCTGASPDDVGGSGTQDNLGCTISIAGISTTDPVCGDDGSISVTAAGAKGAVTFSVSGPVSATNGTGVFTDLGSGIYTITVSDSAFPEGVCTAGDTRTLAAGSDTEAPMPNCPADITVDNDPGECGAVVTFIATATDNCDADPVVSADPLSGSFFAVGMTSVTVTAVDDAANNAQCSFTVTVNDTENCSGGCPGPGAQAIDLPFSYDGAGEFCWVTDGNINFINSWNLALLEINGVSYTNQWATSMPPRIDGNYYIHYVSEFPWGHFEVDGFSPSPNNTCDDPVAISVPFSKDGVGEFCWVTSASISYVNSWNLQLLEINGLSYTNQWSSSLPPRIDGNYYISYLSQVPWGHFEAGTASSLQAPAVHFRNNLPPGQPGLELFPNPAKTIIHIKLQGVEGSALLHISDQLGRMVYSQQVAEGQNILRIDLNDQTFKSGLYFVSLIAQGDSRTVRMLVTR